ncbi:MAG: hypothetical protein LC723_10640, partial [Actinobacteria bacterium]|nr:hypothetical protein [Actinomycetota bacterium]
PSISADGRYVAFGSWDRLSPQDTDNNSDIYIKDTLTGTTTLGSPDVGVANGSCDSHPSISADGTKLMYLAGGWARLPNGLPDPDESCYSQVVIFRDLVTGSSKYINGYATDNAKISRDGRFIAAIEELDYCCDPEIFVSLYDVTSGVLLWQSAEQCRETQCSGELDLGLSISDNGRMIAFDTFQSSPGDTDGNWDVYVHDRDTDGNGVFDEIGKISTYLGGIMPNGTSPWTRYPTLSGDGTTLFFVTWTAYLLIGADPAFDVVARDLSAHTTEVVAFADRPLNDNLIDVSYDGKHLAFTTLSLLTTDDVNPGMDVYLLDRNSRITKLVSVMSQGTPGGQDAFNPAVSSDGSHIAFSTVPLAWEIADEPLNRRVYVRDLSIPCDLPVCDVFPQYPDPGPLPPPIPYQALSTNTDRFAPFDDATVCYYLPSGATPGNPIGIQSANVCTTSSAEVTSISHGAQMGQLFVGGTGYLSSVATGWIAGITTSSAMSRFHASSSATLSVVAKIQGTTKGDYPHSICLRITDASSGTQLGFDCIDKPTTLRDLSATIAYTGAPTIKATVIASSSKDFVAGSIQLTEIKFLQA